MTVGPLSHFCSCGVSSLGRSSTMWNNMLVDKAFCNSTDSGFGKRITFRKGRSITRISFYSSKDKVSFPWRKWWTVVNLPPGQSCSQVSFGEWQSMWLSPHTTSVCHHGHFVPMPIGQWQGWLGNRLPVHRTIILYLIIENLPCFCFGCICLFVFIFFKTGVSSHPLPIWRGSISGCKCRSSSSESGETTSRVR